MDDAPIAEPEPRLAQPDLVDPARTPRLRALFGIATLFFFIVPIAGLLGSRPEPLRLVVGLAGASVFLAGFLGTFAPRWLLGGGGRYTALAGRRGVLVGLTLGVISVALAIADPRSGWFLLFFFTGASYATIRPRRWAIRAIAAISVACFVTQLIVGARPVDAAILAADVALVALMTFGFRILRQTNEALWTARLDLARVAVVEERGRIARDLHDTLGQALTLIALKSQLAGRLAASDPTRAAREMAEVERVARDSLQAVRETVSGYRRPTLASELAAARGAFQAAEIEVEIDAVVEAPLSGPVDEALAWTVREGVTNILRHSGARHAAITVRRDGASVVAEVADDGRRTATVGDAEEDEPGSGPVAMPVGHGLAGLRERLAGLGGYLESGPLSGGGYRVRAVLPASTDVTP
jgi:two-component system sensor histidine kinase DesK